MAIKKTSITYNDYEINVSYKRIKYARIKVSKTAQISMSVPLYYKNTDVLKTLNFHKTWLEKTLYKVNASLPNPNETLLMGKTYMLNFNPELKKVQIQNNIIIIPSEKEFENYKKEFAKIKFKELIDFYLPYIGKKINRIVIRKMKTRWGSCNYKKGYINLNLHLIEKDEKFIKYVILHELTHLIYPHHQKSFYDFIQKIMPEYKQIELYYKD